MKQGDQDAAAIAVDAKDNKVDAAVTVGDVNVSPAVSLSANGSALFSNSNKKDHSKETTDNSQHIKIKNERGGTQTVSNIGNSSTVCSII